MTNDFYKKVLVITVAILIILFAAKRLIIDELKNIKYNKQIDIQTNKKRIDFPEKQKISINWKDANNYTGQYVETTGEIVTSYNSGKVCFLNFHNRHCNLPVYRFSS